MLKPAEGKHPLDERSAGLLAGAAGGVLVLERRFGHFLPGVWRFSIELASERCRERGGEWEGPAATRPSAARAKRAADWNFIVFRLDGGGGRR